MKNTIEKPALLGGKPVRESFLLPFQPSIGQEEIDEVVDTLKSGWLTTGPKAHKFEEMAGKYLNCSNVVAVSSCTAALHLSLAAADIGPGDEVITTPFTFISTANVILHQGAKPVFVDIDLETFNINAGKIEKAITEKTKAIIPVHYAGHPCEMDKILAIAKKHKLIVIEDAAHAFGSEYKGKKIGTIGDFTNFSFYAAKNLTCAEGGMVCAKDKKLAEKIRILSLHGMSKDAWKRYTAAGSWYYEVIYPGYKYNLPDILASIGLHQLKKIDKFISKKEKIARLYQKAFAKMPGITPQKTKEYVKNSYYLYPILINEKLLKIDRDEFIEALKAENIGTSVHFIPVHLHPYYRKTFGFKKGDFPVTESVYERIVSLPIHSAMSFEDANDVIKAVKKIVNYYSKKTI